MRTRETRQGDIVNQTMELPGLGGEVKETAESSSVEIASLPAARHLKIPPILLEGDPPPSDPNLILSPEPEPQIEPQPEPAPETPAPRQTVVAVLPAVREQERSTENRGTMHLLARDPHWLYAYWELPGEDQRQHNALSADHHLIVRVHPETLDAQPVSVAHVHPESQHWFIYVDQAGKPYVAQLGYFLPDRKWVTLATSPVAVTPPDAVSPSTVLQFATIPFDVPLWQLAGAAPNVDQGKEMQAVAARTPVAAGTTATPFERAGRRNAWFPELAQLPGGESFPNIPSWFTTRPGSEVWTLAQAQALAEALRQTDRERARMNSAAIADLIRGAVKMPLPAIDVGGLGLSSPWGVAAPAGFWFRVNAELTVYGATEPDAKVTLDGEPIQLGSDGTFCLRFALPDGQHGLALAAVSSGGDRRQATLRFSRSSEYEADVGVEPRSAVGE